MELNRYGNVDCRQGPPQGWQIVELPEGSDPDSVHTRGDFWDWIETARIEHYPALLGFNHKEAQACHKLAGASFTKSACYTPRLGTLIPSGCNPPQTQESEEVR